LGLLAAGAGSAQAVVTATAVATGGGGNGCAVLTGGTAVCWGQDSNGQLGDDNYRPSNIPVAVQGLTGVTSVSIGETSACAVASGGAYCWGSNASGQLGNGDSALQLSPVPVPVQGLSSGVQSISVGEGFACALLTSGGTQCWGDNYLGELGDGGTEQSSDVPVQVSGLASGAQSISTAAAMACAVLLSGSIDCWGEGYDGQLGNDTSASQSDTPVTVYGLTDATAVAVGDDHVCALAAGAVSCWGENDVGQLGDNEAEQSSDVPVANPTLTSGVIAITSYPGGSCAIEGTATFCWGYDGNGEIGNGTTNDTSVPTPQQVSNLNGALALSLTSDGEPCAVESGGAVACWGEDTGNGTTTSSSTPVLTSLNEMVSVTLSGSGTSTITSIPAGIDCGDGAGTCTALFPTGSQVELVASPAPGSSFAGFTGGGCSGDAILCDLTPDQAEAVTATSELAPTIAVSAPDGGSYAAGSTLTSAFSCQPAANQTLTSCLGSVDGGTGSLSGSALSTAAGTHTFTITAVDGDGGTATTEVTYTAAAGGGSTGAGPGSSSGLPPAPTATIGAPASGATFTLNEYVATSFSCADSAGPGIAACTDSAGDSAPSGALDTSTLGAHTYTVTALSKGGQQATTQITYTVVSPPATPPTAQAGRATVHGDTATFTLGCEGTSGACGASVALLRETSVKVTRHGRTLLTQRTTTLARKDVKLSVGRSRKVSVTLDRAGVRLLAAKHRLPLTLRVSGGSGKTRTTAAQTLTFTSAGRK
ncbi:MAG: hypothetical protein ACRDKL_05575, partial [Solirubrobacteraceae bacterium]